MKKISLSFKMVLNKQLRKLSGAVYYSHDSLRDALYAVTQTACLGAPREDRSLLPGTEARPTDVLIPNWTGGRDTALGMTAINPLQTQLVRQNPNSQAVSVGPWQHFSF